MRVSIGSPGRFWTFDLARQMERLGYLCRLNTAYPRWKVHGLPAEKVRTFPWFHAPIAAGIRYGINLAEGWLNRLSAIAFDQWAARNLEPCDLFHCLSGFGARSGQLARQRFGAVWICDRGSSHIQYQDEILASEYDRWGLPFRHVDPVMIDRELQEYQGADLITVPSQFVYSSFLSKGVPPEKLAKIPFGVDVNLFQPKRKHDDIFRVIFVGQMTIRKGLPDLLHAVLSPRIPNLELWLIGPAGYEGRNILSRYEGQFRHFGPVPQAALAELYSQGSVFVMASIEEGLAMVQAQAMACGLPIIATTNTGAADLFTNGVEGYIVPIRRPDLIREKILQLYEQPDLRDKMAVAALRRVHALGGWDSYGENAAAAYRKTIEIREDNRAASIA
jgi:glycosyltransferase involved in cell wall biosynthesis